jgi:hypothetical protein
MQLESNLTGDTERGSESQKGYDHTPFNNSYEYSRLVRLAGAYYDNMAELRKKFTRDIDYYMGRQLNDTVTYNGNSLTVHDYMEMKGVPAISNDIITDKMVTLKGLVRQQYMAPRVKSVDSEENEYAGLFSEFLRQNDNNNSKSEHAADQFEVNLDLGFVIDKVQWTFREGKEDVFVDAVSPFNIAVPPWQKKDLSDIDFIAEAHDLSWQEILQKFLRKPSDEETLKNIYVAANSLPVEQNSGDTGRNQIDHLDDFYHSSIIGRYRVIEIWTKEYNRAYWYHDRLNATAGYCPLSEKATMDAENERRKQDNIKKDENGVNILDENGDIQYYVDPSELGLIEYRMAIEDVWYYRFLSPNGYLLDEGLSPYKVLRDGYSFYYHPYVFLAYGFFNEIRSYVDRLIDKQRQYNHDNILLDFIIMNSSKGVLAIDEQSLSDKMSVDEIAENYVKVDGTILYTSKKSGNIPQSIQNKSLPAGLDLILNRDRSLNVQQSGIQPALQGVHQNTSGKQYQIEKDSAATSVTDYVSSFNQFTLRVAKRQLWEIQQFYTERRSVMITGEDIKEYFNPQTMCDIDFDLALTLDSSSTVIREEMKDLAYQAYLRDEIEFGQMLDVAEFGDTAKLKKAWQEHKAAKLQAMQEQQQAAAQQTQTPAGNQANAQQPAGGKIQPITNGRPGNGAQHLISDEDDGSHTLVGNPGISS